MVPQPDQYRIERRGRWPMSLCILAWGAQAIVAQSLLLREALVLMYGSELAWGLLLGAWLLGVAGGAALGGRLAARTQRPLRILAVDLLLLSAVTIAQIAAFRGARAWLHVDPGALIPLPLAGLVALLLTAPVGALVGAAFPLACALRGARALGSGSAMAVPGQPASPQIGGAALSLGRVYALESAGSLLGGAAFSFWAVEHLAPIQTALICGAVTSAAVALLATLPDEIEPRRAAGRRRIVVGTLGGLSLATLLTALLAGTSLEHRLVLLRWRTVAPGYELRATAESKYQNLAVGQRAGQFTLYCSGQVTADFPDPYTLVPLAHFWMCQHPDPRHVLVLGGGAEGLLAEILRHPVESVDYLEPDPRQLELVRPFLPPADQAALQDPRIRVCNADARHFMKMQRARYDLAVARLPEPTSALRARFYTAEFFAELRRALRPAAVLCTTLAAAPTDLPAAAAEYVASVQATLHSAFPEVIMGWGDPAQVLAATQSGLVTTNPAELIERYKRRGIVSELFDPLWFEGATDWLESGKVAARATQLAAVPNPQVSTDLRPIVYLQRLALWERMTSASAGWMVGRLSTLRLGPVAAGLGLLAIVVLLLGRWRARGPRGWATGAIVLSVGSTGLATMALSIIWLFSFQNLYGYVYSRIGWIIAVFMGGLVAGCVLAERRGSAARRISIARHGPAAHRPHPTPTADTSPAHGRLPAWGRLIGIDALLAALALATPLVLMGLDGLPGTRATLLAVEWAITVLVAVTGALGGAAFATAAQAWSQVPGNAQSPGQTQAAAGAIVSADHAGACLGALLTGVLLVPVFGIAATALLLAGVKLVSAGVLLVAGRTGQ